MRAVFLKDSWEKFGCSMKKKPKNKTCWILTIYCSVRHGCLCATQIYQKNTKSAGATYTLTSIRTRTKSNMFSPSFWLVGTATFWLWATLIRQYIHGAGRISEISLILIGRA